MLLELIKQLRIAMLLLVFLTMITGMIYPAVVTACAQIFFPWRANGSLLERNGKIVGSELIGQAFTSPTYFWGRPSATTPYPYNAEASSGSNYGPLNPDFLALVKSRKEFLENSDPENMILVPVDLVTASASGLDPDISPAAAFYQISRVAKARQLSVESVEKLVRQDIKNRVWGLFGEPRVNVLRLNLDVDDLDRQTHHIGGDNARPTT